MFKFEIVSLSDLKGHEETERDRLDALKRDLEESGIVRLPVVADAQTKVILDGHHRVVSLGEMGYAKVPAVWVDYLSPKIIVLSWKDGAEFQKEAVIEAGRRARLLPAKTTRHLFRTDSGELVHISTVHKPADIPLDFLR